LAFLKNRLWLKLQQATGVLGHKRKSTVGNGNPCATRKAAFSPILEAENNFAVLSLTCTVRGQDAQMSGSEFKQPLAADLAGYSRLMAADDRATVAALNAGRAIFRAHIDANQGRVIDMAGDSEFAVFESATGAVSAALAVWRELVPLVADTPDDRQIRFPIGVHLSDVIEKADGTIYGDGVNIAARMEGIAESVRYISFR
jgi:hypothetical protein